MAEPRPACEIRRACEADLAFIGDCTRAAYHKFVARLGREPMPVTRDYRDAVAAGEVWILEDGGSPRGLLVVTPEPQALLIYSIAVDPAQQGRGYGGRLLRFAEAEARRQGLGRVRLYTNEKMAENIDLYRAHGYRETHREPFKGSITVHMALELEERGEA